MVPSALLLLVSVFWVLFQANRSIRSSRFLLIMVVFVLAELTLAYFGFFEAIRTQPARMALLVGPGLAFTLWLFFSNSGKAWRSGWKAEPLIMLHIARLPVELMLFQLFLKKLVPEAMTFEGYNFDIISGITAPLALFVFRHYSKENGGLVFRIWNLICLGLLAVVVVTAVLSAPSPFQQLNFDQPNHGILLYPYNLLPAFIVPLVLISHLQLLSLKLKPSKKAKKVSPLQ